MLERMPRWSRDTVRGFLRTGQFRDHIPKPIEPEKSEEMARDLTSMIREAIKADNGEHDINPKDGIFETTNTFIGQVRAEYEVDDSNFGEGYATYYNGERLIYVHHSPEATDLLIFSEEPTVDDGVTHLDHRFPARSYKSQVP